MTARAKICGINSDAAMRAAIDGGAAFVGLVFFPPSPRHVPFEQAETLAALSRDLAAEAVQRVGLFVDPDDDVIADAVAAADLDIVQLHGDETPDRVDAVRKRFGKPVMKAIGVRAHGDLDRAADYFECADYLLFDGLADPDNPIPGGNAETFDWRLMTGRDWPLPWMLAGGLTPDNVARAIHETGAALVDVSSGVEAARGKKDPAKIRAFLAAVASA